MSNKKKHKNKQSTKYTRNRQYTPRKKYEELDFSDDFMFCKILQNNPDLCKELTELIIGKKIGEILHTDSQKPIEITADGKGVRFDVYLQDDTKTIYDIEMQTTSKKDLPKRSRYYQAMIDLNMIERGAKYTDLGKSYVIFICLENPYKEVGLHKYTFENICKERPELSMGDETTRIFLSAEGDADDISDDLKAFLEYLTKKQAESDFTRRLQKEVDSARKHKRWRQEYMTLYEKLQEEREEGFEEGDLHRLIKQICKKLTKHYTVPEISDMLEEDIAVIQDICDVASDFAPEYDTDRIMQELLDR